MSHPTEKIRTRYYTTPSGAGRVRATARGRQTTVEYDHASSDVHRDAAAKLCELLGLDADTLTFDPARNQPWGVARIWQVDPAPRAPERSRQVPTEYDHRCAAPGCDKELQATVSVYLTFVDGAWEFDIRPDAGGVRLYCADDHEAVNESAYPQLAASAAEMVAETIER